MREKSQQRKGGWSRGLESFLMGLVVNASLWAQPAGPGEIRLEAEDGELIELHRSQEMAGYSGSGYVEGFTNTSGCLRFVFQAPAGVYELFLGYHTSSLKRCQVQVNDCRWEVALPARSGFSEAAAGKVYLEESTNRLEIGGGWGYYRIDYVRLAPGKVTLPQPVRKGLSNPRASEAARRLYEYLQSIYGRKVLSGQHSLADYEYVREVTGKSPAILGEDLVQYSPSRIEHGDKPEGSTERWMEHVRKTGCILMLCWHWNAPRQLVNDQETPWWFGFYTRGTRFDVEKALADEQSEDYRLLLRDMDAIAAELRKFREANIPVLWRPLHEASGGWFWWGARGPEPFKKLWRLMYQRYTQHHGLNHLIWVYTDGAEEWYPGDEYVDLVGWDVYEPVGSYMPATWQESFRRYDGRKMMGLSECQAPPNIEKMRQTGCWWLFFAPWSGKYIRGVPVEYLKGVYMDPDVVNLDHLPWNACGGAERP